MAAEQLLAQLVDITEPAYQLPWQIPVGAYIVLVISLLALSYGGWRLVKRHRFYAARRQAITLLGQLAPEHVSEINQLLKRVVLHYAPEHPVLTAGTAQWQNFLQQQLATMALPPLTELLYQPQQNEQQQQAFYQFAKAWLQQCQPSQFATSLAAVAQTEANHA